MQIANIYTCNDGKTVLCSPIVSNKKNSYKKKKFSSKADGKKLDFNVNYDCRAIERFLGKAQVMSLGTI